MDLIQTPLIVAVLASLRGVEEIFKYEIHKAMKDMEASPDDPMGIVFNKTIFH